MPRIGGYDDTRGARVSFDPVPYKQDHAGSVWQHGKASSCGNELTNWLSISPIVSSQKEEKTWRPHTDTHHKLQHTPVVPIVK